MSVPEPESFDVEYCELEQAKLARQPAPAPLAGHVALVTGAASGIGRAAAAGVPGAGTFFEPTTTTLPPTGDVRRKGCAALTQLARVAALEWAATVSG